MCHVDIVMSNCAKFLLCCMESRGGLAMRIMSICPSVCPSVKCVDCCKTCNFVSKRPHWRQIANFQSIFAYSTSAVTPSEKSSINTNSKSTMRFPMSLRWTSYVAPKPRKRGLKPQNFPFPPKIVLWLKKVCYKVTFCKTVSKKVVMHSLA